MMRREHLYLTFLQDKLLVFCNAPGILFVNCLLKRHGSVVKKNHIFGSIWHKSAIETLK